MLLSMPIFLISKARKNLGCEWGNPARGQGGCGVRRLCVFCFVEPKPPSPLSVSSSSSTSLNDAVTYGAKTI